MGFLLTPFVTIRLGPESILLKALIFWGGPSTPIGFVAMVGDAKS